MIYAAPPNDNLVVKLIVSVARLTGVNPKSATKNLNLIDVLNCMTGLSVLLKYLGKGDIRYRNFKYLEHVITNQLLKSVIILHPICFPFIKWGIWGGINGFHTIYDSK